jgi:hypothetical protein
MRQMAHMQTMDTQNQIDRVLSKHRRVMARMHRSYATEKSYAGWIRRYILWLDHHPDGTSAQKANRYLTYLAADRNVSASTQTHARHQ